MTRKRNPDWADRRVMKMLARGTWRSGEVAKELRRLRKATIKEALQAIDLFGVRADHLLQEPPGSASRMMKIMVDFVVRELEKVPK